MENLENKIGYRILKVLYYFLAGLSFISLILFLIFFEGDPFFLILTIIFYILVEVLSLGIFYVFFGKLENYKFNIFYKILKKQNLKVFFALFLILFLTLGYCFYNIYTKNSIIKKYSMENWEYYKYKEYLQKNKTDKDFQDYYFFEKCKKNYFNQYQKNDGDSIVNFMRFTDKEGNCYGLLEVDKNGGSGVINTFLYDIKNEKFLKVTTNQISKELDFGGKYEVYLNRLDDLLDFEIGKFFTEEKVAGGTGEHEYSKTFENLLEFREKNNYKRLKESYYKLEKQVIEETKKEREQREKEELIMLEELEKQQEKENLEQIYYPSGYIKTGVTQVKANTNLRKFPGKNEEKVGLLKKGNFVYYAEDLIFEKDGFKWIYIESGYGLDKIKGYAVIDGFID